MQGENRVWQNAIVQKFATSCDYADWLGPYLRPSAFEDPSYADFWLKDLTAIDVPLNRLVELVSFYQQDAKITHGNAQDQLHAGHWLMHDMFFTADRHFHESLSKVATARVRSEPGALADPGLAQARLIIPGNIPTRRISLLLN